MFRRWWTAGLALALAGALRTAGAAPPDPYVLGLMSGNVVSSQDFAQILNLMRAAAGGYEQETGTRIRVDIFRDKPQLERAVLAGKVHVLLNTVGVARKEMGFIPLVTYGLFGTLLPEDCLFVTKDSPVTSVAGLKGRSVAIRLENESGFTRLQTVLGQNPAHYFAPLLPAKNDASLAYMASLGQTDAIWTSRWNLDYLKLTNPGPAKDLRPVPGSCMQTCPAFITASPAMPPRERERFADFLVHLKKTKSMKRYRALVDTVGLVMKPYEKTHDAICTAYYDKLHEHQDGGDSGDDFRQWYRYQGGE